MKNAEGLLLFFFLNFFWDIFVVVEFCGFFWIFLDFILYRFFFGFYGFLAKLLRLLLKVTKVKTGNQKWAKTE